MAPSPTRSSAAHAHVLAVDRRRVVDDIELDAAASALAALHPGRRGRAVARARALAPGPGCLHFGWHDGCARE